ncbi:hypothetical protein OIDMADRAFT_60809 [Oidiodendron maius Zn]|uniref:Uncharacterized protein n=1 Tax=Oidiodendron maius (strain Zn) TaxID=913774 RepID=A0A0C3CXS3_OIDMZ|nr:hypothetical protein OIDMADRAFT_60809 [Oidiodendron maius Zn]
MTVQLSSSGSVQGFQLGLNEAASALTLGSRIGSVLTRRHKEDTLTILLKGFDVRVQDVPTWLSNFRFSRKIVLHGENLRAIPGGEGMKQEDLQSIGGIATLVALCCQWTHKPIAMGTDMVGELVRGMLGPVVHPGKLPWQDARFKRGLAEVIEPFVRSTMDADGGSSQAQTVHRMMAQVSMKAGRTSFDRVHSERQRRSNLRLLCDLLGDPGTLHQRLSDPTEQSVSVHIHQESRIHDTMSIESASIAMAAAVNSADVVVECHASTETFYLPEKPVSWHDRPYFLVRLWLRQPPQLVSNLILSTESQWGGRASSYPDDSDPNHRPCYPTLYGGKAELALAVATAIQFTGRFSRDPFPETARELWQLGFDCGSKLVWKVSHAQGRFKFMLEYGDQPPPRLREDLSSLVDRNLRGSRGDKRTRQAIDQEICQILHEIYQLESYDSRDLHAELEGARLLIKIAMGIGALDRITHCSGSETASYVLNGEVLSDDISANVEDDMLPHLVELAIDKGLNIEHLIVVASSVWTGSTRASRNYTAVNSNVIGVTGPQGTVVLEMLHDPVQFAERGIQGPLLYLVRGPVPILNRDTRTGYVISAKRAMGAAEWKGRDLGDIIAPIQDPVITLEPDISSSETLIIGWWGGDLAFELSPYWTFRALLKTFNPPQEWTVEEHELMCPVFINPLEIIKMKHFYVKGRSAAVRACSGTWLFAAAGLADPAKVLICRDNLDLKRLSLPEGHVLLQYCP